MAEKDEVSVVLSGRKFFAWRSVDLSLAMDTFSSLSLSAPYESSRREFRDLFRPFEFGDIECTVDDKRIFKGTVVGVAPADDATSSTVEVTAYSLPGVLDDCPAPASALPIEFRKLGLRAIAEAVAKPFGLDVEFDADEGTPFAKAKLDADQQVSDFLGQLARQRNLVISSTPDGALLCWQSVVPGRPVATLREQEQPVIKVSATFSPQEYFSEITGFAAAKRGRGGAKFTEQNPFLSGVLRPHSFTLQDTDKGDAPAAVKAKLGRMFANMASFSVDVATWRDPQGDLWQPNTTLVLEAPNAMVYSEYEFLIRSVTLHQDAASTTATLGLVLPGAFRGEIPSELPWDG